jgi:hypothetical protein
MHLNLQVLKVIGILPDYYCNYTTQQGFLRSTANILQIIDRPDHRLPEPVVHFDVNDVMYVCPFRRNCLELNRGVSVVICLFWYPNSAAGAQYFVVSVVTFSCSKLPSTLSSPTSSFTPVNTQRIMSSPRLNTGLLRFLSSSFSYFAKQVSCNTYTAGSARSVSHIFFIFCCIQQMTFTTPSSTKEQVPPE